MKSNKFKVPTIIEVEDYFKIKDCYAKKEVSKFWYYYESVGWYVGRNKMRSWKAAASGWILRMEQFNKPVDTMIPGPPKVALNRPWSKEEREEINLIKLGYERLKLNQN